MNVQLVQAVDMLLDPRYQDRRRRALAVLCASAGVSL